MNQQRLNNLTQHTLGIFLDAENIAITTCGILNQALDYRKLLEYISDSYGRIQIAIAYYDFVPDAPYLTKWYSQSSFDSLMKEMHDAGWATFLGPPGADEAIIRDMSKTSHLYDHLILLSSDYEIIQHAVRIKKIVTVLKAKDLISIPWDVIRSDLTFNFIRMAIDKNQKDIAAVLLGVKLEQAIDTLAQKFDIAVMRDPLQKVTKDLHHAKIISIDEFNEIDKYRKIRNAAVHAEQIGYSLKDVMSFYNWLQDWTKERKI